MLANDTRRLLLLFVVGDTDTRFMMGTRQILGTLTTERAMPPEKSTLKPNRHEEDLRFVATAASQFGV